MALRPLAGSPRRRVADLAIDTLGVKGSLRGELRSNDRRDRTAIPSFAEAVRLLLSNSMTKLLEQAIEAVRLLPADSQDDIARAILHLAGDEVEAEPVDPAHLAAVLEGLAQAKGREFATDDEVEAAFRRF